MIKPKRLKPAETIGIVAPASSFDLTAFKQGLDLLESLGYRVKYERIIFNPRWSNSGRNRQRAYQINRMFADPEIRAIFCAEAGYGSAEIIPYLDKKTIRKNPKIFVGYSDITIILLYLERLAKMVVFHGPVVADEIYEGMHQLTLRYLIKLLAEPVALEELKFPQLIAFKPGQAFGRIVGGNMSLIIESIKSPYKIRTANTILFLEDVDENLATIKNYFFRLWRYGKFRKIKGLLLGRMLDASGKDHDLRSFLTDMFRKQDIPILYGFPSGHRRLRGELQVTLPLGALATIDTDRLSLTINESAVE